MFLIKSHLLPQPHDTVMLKAGTMLLLLPLPHPDLAWATGVRMRGDKNRLHTAPNYPIHSRPLSEICILGAGGRDLERLRSYSISFRHQPTPQSGDGPRCHARLQVALTQGKTAGSVRFVLCALPSCPGGCLHSPS